jgi:hypothetical protein
LEQYFVAMAALSVSLVNIDDGLKEHVFVVGEGRNGHPRTNLRTPFLYYKPAWDGVVLAAIESYRDERAREFLLEYGLRKPQDDEVDSMADWALVFLRGFDPEAVTPRIEATLREEPGDGLVVEQSVPWSSKAYSQRYEFYTKNWAFSLQNLLRSLEYVQLLSLEQREAYQYFEMSRWWSHAFVRRGTRAYLHGVPDWREGNERFVLALLEMNPSGEQYAYGIGLRNIPLEGLLWLKQQAESGNWPAGDWADDLKKRLEGMINAEKRK